MKLFRKTRAVPTAVVLGLALVLVVLAAVQYRWSTEVSAAASERMKANVQAAVNGFRHDFYRELATICSALLAPQPTGGRNGEPLTNLAAQFHSWTQSAAHPDLVANIFVVETAGTRSLRLLQLNTATGAFAAVDWPDGLQPLAQHLSGMASRMPPHELHESREDFMRRGARRDFDASFAGHAPPFAGPLGGPWMVDQDTPALVHRFIGFRAGDEREVGSVRWLVIELNPKVLREHIFPELAERYFGSSAGLEYNVAVLGTNEGQVLYSSDPKFGRGASADATLSLFGAPIGPPPGSNPPRNDPQWRFGRHHDPMFALPRFEPIRASADTLDWQLIVQHRRGSLDAVVAGMRRRNLGISFGVLLVLAATMALIISASHRAQRLAQLQMDFVAGVSHELRTPLAVITSAADNIADGVIDSKQQLARYGTVIKKQAAQLNHLVEQILLFAAARQHRLSYALRPLRVADVIDTAVSHVADLVRENGCTVERSVAPDLPRILGELAPLSHCLQNLITNAVKYGGEDRWIGIGAALASNGREVLITVADHGAGITSGELEQIFEPFYRSPAATEAQIHGTGLGLPLARSIAEAMHGSLAVTSELGRGTTFTLHLTIAESAPAEVAAQAGTSGS